MKKKKRKLGPTDRQSGSVHVTMTPPSHADKDCLTTEENVTISSSCITRQGHCRSGAAESSLVARNHQPTNGRRPQRTTGDTRTVAWWNLRGNVTDDKNERRAAQWRTCKVGRALAHNWRERKKVSGMSERAKYVRELPVAGNWRTASRSTKFSRSRSSKRKNISVDERKRDAVARLCLDGTDVLNIDRQIAAL